MQDVARAILYTIDDTGIELPGMTLVINDQARDLTSRFPDAQFWDPETQTMPGLAQCKSVILLAPKQKDETRALIALGLKTLSQGGVFIVAATNESGGRVLAKHLSAFGLAVRDVSKHKCRVVWTTDVDRATSDEIEKALVTGGVQKRPDGLWSQPGLFSWDHLDKGTDALLHHLPFSLAGRGADFGCGVGVLGQRLFQRYKDITQLYCLDRDVRALECCRRNLEAWAARAEIRQADLTKTSDLNDLDFIVMNPPFHMGKSQSTAMGQAFIDTAARALKKDGMLVFVANSHLPYEETVKNKFSFHRILKEEHGFKIIEAVK